MADLRLLYIASSHGKELDYHLRQVAPEMAVKGLWISGCKVKRMTDYVKRLRRDVVSFRPNRVIIFLLHNNICFHLEKNPTPTAVNKAVEEFMELVQIVRELVPLALVMASCPLPRVACNSFNHAMCSQYNRMAVSAGEALAARKNHLPTIFPYFAWENVKSSRTGVRVYFRSRDGLHLTPNGKRELAKLWTRVCKEG